MSLAQSVDTVEQQKTGLWGKLVDAFIDKDISRYSVRLLNNFKDSRFYIKNEDYIIEYVASNRAGIGFGIANSKLVVDLIFNLKLNKEEPTDRFDMQGDMLIGRSYVTFQLQNYQGYNVQNISIEDPGTFREDIKFFGISLGYLYGFKREIYSMQNIFSGIESEPKSRGTFLGGTYFNYHRVKADSSIIPESSADLFNEQAQITQAKQYGFGINAGYSYFFNLPARMYLLITLAPGTGISIKDIQTETGSYIPTEIWEGAFFTYVQLGYNAPRWYIDLSNANQWYVSSFGYGNRGNINGIKFKLVIGWKFRRHDILK